MKKILIAAMVAIAFAPAGEALAAELIVFDARGIDLQPGQIIDGAQPLVLGAGQEVTLIAANGRTFKLTGPYDKAPAPKLSDNDPSVIDALKTFVTPRQSATGTLGVTREAAGKLPEPWVVDVSEPGNRCVREGDRVILWRPLAALDEPVLLLADGGAWRASTTWPSNYNLVRAPENMPVADGGDLVVEVGGKRAVVTLHVVPKAVKSAPATAAWMIGKGCSAQAAVLAARLE